MTSLRRCLTPLKRPKSATVGSVANEKILLVGDWNRDLLLIGMNLIESIDKLNVRKVNKIVLQLNILILNEDLLDLKSKIIGKWLKAGASLKIHDLLGTGRAEGDLRERILHTISEGSVNDIVSRSELSGVAFSVTDSGMFIALDAFLEGIATTFLPKSYYSPTSTKATVSSTRSLKYDTDSHLETLDRYLHSSFCLSFSTRSILFRLKILHQRYSMLHFRTSIHLDQSSNRNAS